METGENPSLDPLNLSPSHLKTIYLVAARLTEAAHSLQPLQPTLAEIQTILSTAFKAGTSYIALLTPDRSTIEFPHATHYDVPLALQSVDIDDPDSLVAWVIRNNQPYITGDWLAEEDKPVVGIRAREREISRSIMCYPLEVAAESGAEGSRVLGALSIQSDEPHAFDEADQQLLEAIVGQVAVIIDNARLYSESQASMEKIHRHYTAALAMQKAITAVSSSLDLREVLDHLLEALREVVPYDEATIALIEEESREWGVGNRGQESDPPYDHLILSPHSLTYRRPSDEKAAVTASSPVWRNSALVGEILHRREPILVGDTRQEARWIAGKTSVLSWIGAPLIAGEKLLGVLMIDSAQPNAYGPQEKEIVATLAAQAAIAVQNASLHEEIQQQLTELATMYEATAAMTADIDRSAVLRAIVSEMLLALDAAACAIFAVEGRGAPLAAPLLVPVASISRTGEPASIASFEGLQELPIVQQVIVEQEPAELSVAAAHGPAEARFLRVAGMNSLIFLPLGWRGNLLGVLVVGREESPGFLRREIGLARNLATQASVALEHARLYTHAQRLIADLATFHQASLKINALDDLQSVLATITETALKLVDANDMHIYLYDKDRGRDVSRHSISLSPDSISFGAALWRDGRRLPAQERVRPDGLTAHILRRGEPLIIDDATTHPLFARGAATDWGIQAIAGFPLKLGQRVVGAMTVAYQEPHHYSEDEVLLLSLLADQTAVAIENVRLFDETQRRLTAMSALVGMAQQITGNLIPDRVMQITVDILQSLLAARAASIVMRHGDELVVEAAAGIRDEFRYARIKIGEGVSGKAVAQRRPVYVADAYGEANFLFFDRSVRSLLSVPLIVRDEVIGAMAVDSDQPDAFDESDIQLMMIAASQVGIAIANARLYEQAEERALKLAIAYEELKESDQLKDELVQNLSHELRTPLTFVQGYVDLLLAGEMGDINEMQREALQIVSDKTVEITRLVTDIMTLERVAPANLVAERFDLVEVIGNIVASHEMREADEGKITFACQLPATPIFIQADKSRLLQLLDNLLDNARKFSPNGGLITVTLREQGEELLVSVADEGIGIPESKLERIFERFYQVDGTTSRRFQGAGIGLSLVQRIVQAHGGRIWAESRLGEGSTFTFTLPKEGVASRE